MTTRYDQMLEDVRKFHDENPEVWKLFCRYTFKVIEAGFDHYGAQAIFQRIRWHELIDKRRDPAKWKVNNNHIPFYARAFMKRYPEYQGFFRTRHQISHEAPAAPRPELGPDDYGE